MYCDMCVVHNNDVSQSCSCGGCVWFYYLSLRVTKVKIKISEICESSSESVVSIVITCKILMLLLDIELSNYSKVFVNYDVVFALGNRSLNKEDLK